MPKIPDSPATPTAKAASANNKPVTATSTAAAAAAPAKGKGKQQPAAKAPASSVRPERPILYGPNVLYHQRNEQHPANCNSCTRDPSKVGKPVYPLLKVSVIDAPKAKALLHWEDEPSYTVRKLKEDPSLDPAKAVFDDWGKSPYLDLKDEDGRRVRCWNVYLNRPFDEPHCRSIAQDILSKKWRLNFENVIIGVTGRVLSGQHRLPAIILAEQMRCGRQALQWAEFWQGPVSIETSVAMGVDESAEVIQTLDNVKTRSLSDTIYTSDLFPEVTVGTERKECARMLGVAVDFMWKRTGAMGVGKDSATRYQTHAASQEFLKRHPKLEECVTHLFQENRERSISDLRLSAGQCAAMCYLMATSDSDRDEYHATDPGDRNEAMLDWSRWKEAKAFWAAMAVKDSIPPVKTQLDSLIDENDGTVGGGRQLEKAAILTKAWAAYLERGGRANTITDEDVNIDEHYVTDEATGLARFKGHFSFGGIDLGMQERKTEEKKDPAAPTKEEIERQKEEERKRRDAERFARAEELNRKLNERRAAKGLPPK